MPTPHILAPAVAPPSAPPASAAASRPSLPFMTTRAAIAPGDTALGEGADGDEAATPATARPGGKPTPRDLDLINRFARTPLSPDQVYVVPAEISNQSVDSYFTRMTPLTLANYARDASAGVAFLDSHEKRRLPMGRSYFGQVTSDQARGMQTTQSLAYMRRGLALSNGLNSDDVIAGIEAGIYRDVSVGFVPARFWCSICKRDMLSDPECYHVPGMRYESRDGASQMCVADVDAGLAEYSLVYHHATDDAAILPPSAMQLKAERLLAEGRADIPLLRFVEEVCHVRMFDRFPGLSLPVSSVTGARPTAATGGDDHAASDREAAWRVVSHSAPRRDQREDETEMTGADFVRGVLAEMERAGAEISQANHTTLRAILADLEAGHGTLGDAVARMGAFLTDKQRAPDATPAADASAPMGDNDQNPQSATGNAQAAAASATSAQQGMDLDGGGPNHGIDAADAHKPNDGRAASDAVATVRSDKGVDTDSNEHDAMTTSGKGHMHGDLLMHQHEGDADHSNVPEKQRAEGADGAAGQDSRPNGDGADNDDGNGPDADDDDDAGAGGSQADRALAPAVPPSPPTPVISEEERELLVFAREQKAGYVREIVADAVRVYGSMTDAAQAAYSAMLQRSSIAELTALREQGRQAAKAALSPVGVFHEDRSKPGGGVYDSQPTGAGGRQTVARNANDPLSLSPAGARPGAAPILGDGASYTQRHEGYGVDGLPTEGADPSLFRVGPRAGASREKRQGPAVK